MCIRLYRKLFCSAAPPRYKTISDPKNFISNKVYYLIEPKEPDDLPQIMHWLNWYTAMCFNRMMGRTGHFWEKRYHSTGFPVTDKRRALNTLRYIHGNPKAASMQQGWFYDFSNYGTYDRLTQDGISQ